MEACLGIYIDRKIIKYAKLSKDKDSIKIDSFGVEIYTDISQTIEKIIEETFSYKIPISVNLSDETYEFLSMSGLLSEKDLTRAIKTEFESNCVEKDINSNALETRFALVNDANEKDKMRVIHVSIDKMKLNKIINKFEGHKVNSIVPLPLAIANIVQIDSKKNSIIVNIEDTTTITVITGEKVYDIRKIDNGIGNIFDQINAKENSFKKSYEICKNTTIYTMQGQELKDAQSNEYMSDIIPTLYEIATNVKDIIDSELFKINKVYITGSGSVINNVDLYFEEIIQNMSCEILKPFFIEESPKINMKDYIEVNSAIALALQCLGMGIKKINFSNEKLNKLNFIKIKEKNGKENSNNFFSKLNNVSIPNSKIFGWLIRTVSTISVIFVVYIAISLFIGYQISKKEEQLDAVKGNTEKQIALIKKDTTSVNNKVTEYSNLTKRLKEATDAIEVKNSYKNVIPTLLSQIMSIIPKEVQLTSIENSTEKKITINAQSSKYEQLAYFKARLKAEGIFEPSSVVSTDAVKESDTVKITIEGVLP